VTDPADIAAFLEARLREEEEAARAAPAGPWSWEATGASGYPQRITNSAATLIAECFENPDRPASCAEHIARQNPAVTLPRGEALRAFVAWARYTGGSPNDPYLGVEEMTKETALLYLARAYRLRPDGSQHPDWREEWSA
jgi:hypothetical protein